MAPRRTRYHAVQHAQRSMLLEDFRDGRYPNLQLADIVSHVIEFATDHEGSKFIQRKLDEATDQRKSKIFREIQSNLRPLIMDPFANFVVQKLIDVGSDAQRQILFLHVQTHFMQLSLHKYGCRVVQKAIELAPMDIQSCLLQSCAGNNVIRLATDANGNHVIQGSFRVVPQSIRNFLYEQIKNHMVDLCFDLYGCRVVQCILDHGTWEHRSEFINRLDEKLFYRMIQDRYGNYVIQHALQFSPPNERNRLIESILLQVYDLSLEKYASNVVEKCFNLASPEQQHQAIERLCNQRDEFLRGFCIERYANYVVQKMIEKATIEQLRNLHGKLLPHFGEIRRFVSGQKIITKLFERMNI